jgi:hypothetical protein
MGLSPRRCLTFKLILVMEDWLIDAEIQLEEEEQFNNEMFGH